MRIAIKKINNQRRDYFMQQNTGHKETKIRITKLQNILEHLKNNTIQLKPVETRKFL